MIYTNFKLPTGNVAEIRMIEDLYSGWVFFQQIVRGRSEMSALLIANPSTKILLQLGVMRLVRIIPCPVFLFDLILKSPQSISERVVAKCKGVFISMLDFIVSIHKDTSGYERAYGLKKSQFIYVPFKANNFHTREAMSTSEGDYVVALGASQRDYKTLIKAAAYTSEKIVIVCSDDNAYRHNADVGKEEDYSPNITRIRETLDSQSWYQYLANCKFVVIPISASAIQPAGVSVYLEAMILKKAVIVSTGASVNQILHDGQEAVLVPPGDFEKLAQAISQLGCDQALRSKIAQAGYEYALSLGDDAKLRQNILELIIKNDAVRK